MRTFYIFKIKKYYAVLTKKNPYHLYKTMENIYHLKPEELMYKINVFDNLKENFNKEYLNNNIYELYKDKHTYTKFQNIHMINDYYTDEQSKLIVNKTYLLIKTTKEYPSFLKVLENIKDNIFVCDFKNKDYFWLEDVI